MVVYVNLSADYIPAIESYTSTRFFPVQKIGINQPEAP